MSVFPGSLLRRVACRVSFLSRWGKVPPLDVLPVQCQEVGLLGEIVEDRHDPSVGPQASAQGEV